MTPLLLLLATASGGEIRAWTQSQFPQRPPNGYAAIVGGNGWVGGYADDDWTGSQSGGEMIPTTDANEGDVAPGQRGWGRGGPVDNWIVRPLPIGDGGVVASLGNYDDDAIGVVLNHDQDDSFYLAFHSCGSRPAPAADTDECRLVLLRVDDGQARVLGEQRAPELNESPVALRLTRDDATITATFANATVTATDPTPLPAGAAGAWAYDCGVDSWSAPRDLGAPCFVAEITTFWFDADDDGVADDDDLCETVADPGQEDADGDGLGDACDPTPGTDPDPPVDTDDTLVDTDDTQVDTDDTQVDTDGDGPGDGPGDTDGAVVDTDAGPGGGPGVVPADERLVIGCDGCAGGAGGPGAGLLAGLVLLAARRRRQGP